MQPPRNLPERDTSIEALASLFARVMLEMRLCDELSEELFGVTAAHLRLLCEICIDDDLSVTDLSERLSTHQSTVSAHVAALRNAGLVLQLEKPGDSRFVLVRPTSKGRAVAKKSNQIGRPLLSSALMQMTSTELNRVSKCLRSLADGMEAERNALVDS